MLAFAVGSLSIIGLPPLGGAWSKWYLGLGALESGQGLLLGVLLLSSLLNVAYLLPIPVLDGGHILILGVEASMRRELSMRLKERVMQAGVAFLLLFFVTIVVFDIIKAGIRT